MHISKELEERVLNVFGTKEVINVQEDRYMPLNLNITQYSHILNYDMILKMCTFFVCVKKAKVTDKKNVEEKSLKCKTPKAFHQDQSCPVDFLKI